MLMQVEIQLEKSNVDGAEATVREYQELQRQHIGHGNSRRSHGNDGSNIAEMMSLLSSSRQQQISKQRNLAFVF